MSRSSSSSLRLVIGIAAAGFALSVSACSESPLRPSVGGIPGALDAKAPSGSPHSVAFGPVLPDDGPGYIEAGAQPLTGSMSGSEAAGTLRVNVQGAYTWTIVRVAPLPQPGSSCTDAERAFLDDRDVVGSPISGTLTLTADKSRLDFSMTGIVDRVGAPWAISGHSTVNFLPVLTGDVNAATIVMEWATIGFKLNPKGKVGADQTIGCKVDFTATVVKSS